MLYWFFQRKFIHFRDRVNLLSSGVLQKIPSSSKKSVLLLGKVLSLYIPIKFIGNYMVAGRCLQLPESWEKALTGACSLTKWPSCKIGCLLFSLHPSLSTGDCFFFLLIFILFLGRWADFQTTQPWDTAI